MATEYVKVEDIVVMKWPTNICSRLFTVAVDVGVAEDLENEFHTFIKNIQFDQTVKRNTIARYKSIVLFLIGGG